MSFQQYGKKTINTFLADGKYYIPNYQREYAWEENELLDFWNDLENLRNSEQNQDHYHFFGQVVIHNDEEARKKYIIDGQQRTITSMIFLRVLQKVLEDIKNSEDSDSDTKRNAGYDANDIEVKNIGRYIDSSHDNLNLTLDETNAVYFRDNILLDFPKEKRDPKIEQRKAQERMRFAFWFFHKKIMDVYQTEQCNYFELIHKYYKLFTENFVILYMEATKLEEAFIIFETLNARGKDLETADLLKNYIFSKSANNIQNVEKNWQKMISILENNDPTKYIRYFWNSKFNHTSEKSLYKEITRKIDNPRDCNDLLNKLVTLAPVYHDLVNPDDCSYFKDELIKKKLLVLKDLKASTFYPIILSMKNSENDFTDDDIAKVLDKIISLIFRNITICNLVAKEYEIAFSRIAKEIFETSIDSVEKICSAIDDKIVSDADFAYKFTDWSGSPSSPNKNIIRYVLRTIYEYNPQNQEICTNNNFVHIEHIMPIDNSKWTNVTEEDHDEYLWKLGNLTLLAETKNISASNGTFDEKKPYYIQSKIEENIELAQIDEWTIEQIQERQKKLCEIAKQIWKKDN